METVLPYRILEDCFTLSETEDIEQYQVLVLACIDQSLSPLATAQQITALLADHASRDKAVVDAQARDQIYPSNIDTVATAVGSVASSFPPGHPAHERLCSMLKRLLLVEPKHQVPNPVVGRDGRVRSVHEGSGHFLNTRPSLLLWESLDQLHVEENFSLLADIGQSKWSGVEKCGSEEQQRWRNFSFFCAKLTQQSIADLSYLSALFMLLPQARIPKISPGWSGFLAGQSLAAAQWLIPEEHAAWVWKRCCHRDRLQEDVPLPRRTWNREYWTLWKDVFREVADRKDDERVHEAARQAASDAIETMTKVEE